MRKTIIILLIAVPAIAACEKFSLNRNNRNELFPPGGHHGGQEEGTPDDTLVYLSAVLVPRNYDWRRDTAYGYPGSELMLLRNGEIMASMRTGPGEEVSPNPFTHHLLGGHLYTEYSSDAETVIKKDGAELFRYSGAEVLAGILPSGEDVYTLGTRKDGDGFALRKNGEMLFRQVDGDIFGGFSYSAYGRTGALYEDEGHCCFCFRSGTDFYKVTDGEMERLNIVKSATRVLDVRIYRSEVYYAVALASFVYLYVPSKTYVMSSAYRWHNVELFPSGGEMWFIASGIKGGAWHTVSAPVTSSPKPEYYRVFPGRFTFIYPAGEDCHGIDISGGGVRVSDPGEALCYERDSTFFFSYSCADVCGNSFFMALTPKEREMSPLIWHDGEERPFDLQGYLTGIDVELNRSN